MKTLPKALLLVSCCLVLALPQLADAKAGGGRSSMGSMGGRTYQSAPSYGAKPIQRSITPQAAPAAPAAAPMAPMAPAYAGNSHPFLSGIAGGLLGAGIGSMLFGHSFGGGMGMGGGFGSGGGILSLLIWGVLGYFVFRWVRNRFGGGGTGSSGPMGGFSNPFARNDAPFNAAGLTPLDSPAMRGESMLMLTADDYQAFTQLLEKIQLTWGSADIARLRQYVTPEMLSYFNEELAANSSRGIFNRITDVTVVPCTSADAWSEQGLDYATTRMQWRAVDFMARLDRQPSDADYVVSGDAQHAVDAEEVWTFVRARDGGHWMLSAIQQVG